MTAVSVRDLVKEFRDNSALVQNFYQHAAGPLLNDHVVDTHARHLQKMFTIEQQLRIRGYERIMTYVRTEHDLKTVRSMDRHPVKVRGVWLTEVRNDILWRVDAVMGSPS